MTAKMARRAPARPVAVDARELGLETERIALERRLDDGYRRIEAARLDGVDVTAWEEFWVQLLREYEAISDRADRLAA